MQAATTKKQETLLNVVEELFKISNKKKIVSCLSKALMGIECIVYNDNLVPVRLVPKKDKIEIVMREEGTTIRMVVSNEKAKELLSSLV